MFGMMLLALLGATPVKPPVGQWVYQEQGGTDGARFASASVRDVGGNRLSLRCDLRDKPVLSVRYEPRRPLKPGAARLIQLNFDNKRAEIGNWTLPGAAAVQEDDTTVYIYATEFASAKRISVGLSDGGKPVGAYFAGARDDRLFRRLFAACGTPYAMPDPYAKSGKPKPDDAGADGAGQDGKVKKRKKRGADE